MLCLNLKPDEFILIGNVVIRGVADRSVVRLAIAAPEEIGIHRLDRHANPINLGRRVLRYNTETFTLSCGHQVPIPTDLSPADISPEFRMECPHCAAHCHAVRPLIEHHFSDIPRRVATPVVSKLET